ncbi:MAG: hypothetical protein AAY43_12020 [Methanosarcina sp. 795]|nr:MAG: hypothetical protein AAY43_12020 [Methanosarcina sp. 795]
MDHKPFEESLRSSTTVAPLNYADHAVLVKALFSLKPFLKRLVIKLFSKKFAVKTFRKRVQRNDFI